MEKIIYNLDEMRSFAKAFLAELGGGKTSATIVGLSGNLGAGKTAFVKELAKELGIKQHITSPTFVIMKKYNTAHSTFHTLIHIDAYRLCSGEDLKTLGWDELINNPQNLILIEWPEQISEALPKTMIKLLFGYVDENTRKVNF